MRIISFNDCYHDAAISASDDDELLASFKEERFTRLKTDEDLKEAPKELEKFLDISFKNNDLEFCSATNLGYKRLFQGKHDYIINPDKWNFGKKILEQYGKTLYTYDHQFCHALAAYYSSGFGDKKTLIVSFDGIASNNSPHILNKHNLYSYDDHTFGEASNCCKIYSAKNNKFKELFSVGAFSRNFLYNTLSGNSNFSFITGAYTKITDLLGFKGNCEEGKTLGLSVQGSFNEKYYNILKQIFPYNSLTIDYGALSLGNFLLERLFDNEKINEYKEKRKDLAYALQQLSEEYILLVIKDIIEKYPGHTHLCLSGGLFANVKINQKINELLPFEETWVFPAMGDEGISIGVAKAHLLKHNIPIQNKRIENMFYGIGYSQAFIDDCINYNDYNCEIANPEKIAKILHDGFIVGMFRGRSEVGPRALGNRSILADPRKRETHEYLNSKLQRNDIMPFAPMIMSEYISEVCHAYKSIRTSEFMTMCYTVKDQWVDKIPAALAPEDNSCRPQTVFRERNEFCHSILSEFYKLTGVPAVVNTSFNAHGDPIINHPQHAIEYLNKDVVDYLVLGDKLVSKK